MKSKIVKCRKSHDCSVCEDAIQIGEMAIVQEFRAARFDLLLHSDGEYTDKQIGIQFCRFYFHSDHDNEKDCPECNHRTAYKETRSHNQAQSAKYECSNCGYQTTFP